MTPVRWRRYWIAFSRVYGSPLCPAFGELPALIRGVRCCGVGERRAEIATLPDVYDDATQVTYASTAPAGRAERRVWPHEVGEGVVATRPAWSSGGVFARRGRVIRFLADSLRALC